MKRTPGPWLVSDPVIADKAYDLAIYVILDGEKRIIAECFGRSDWDHEFPSAANASFIAMAANTYDELVVALKGVTGLVRLLSARSDLQPDRAAILSNHRFLEAERVLAKVQS